MNIATVSTIILYVERLEGRITDTHNSRLLYVAHVSPLIRYGMRTWCSVLLSTRVKA